MSRPTVFIDGQFAEPHAQAVLPSINPATEERIADIANCDADDVDRAVQSARRAFDEGSWATTKAPERARLLKRIADGIRARADDLARIETADSGKPIFDNTTADIPDAAACFEHFAGWASTLAGSVLELPFGDYHDYTIRQPLGVVAAIAPWNFPLVNAAWKIAPVLAAGNCVVYKPAEDTSLSALLLAEIVRDAELPRGVVNIITGTGAQTGAALVAHPAIDKVSFTGSTPTGRGILRASAEFVRPTLVELGGKSSNLVFDDCDLDAAIDGALFGVFFNAGQVCTAGSRLLIQRGIYDQFVERMIAGAQSVAIGDPTNPTTRMGPLVSREQLNRVRGFVDRATRHGAHILIGGARPRELEQGWFFAPTILTHVQPGSEIDMSEVFGPVLVVHAFDDDDDAVALANATSYGLAAGVWTQDVTRAHRLARPLDAGTVWINCYNVAAVNVPNPAWKSSGIGSELGREGFEAYTKLKNVCVDLSRSTVGYFRSTRRD